MAYGNTGLLIVRAYSESGSSAPLRAVIRLTSDVSAGIERSLTLTDKDAVAEVVRSWLDDILDGAAAGSSRHVAGTRWGRRLPGLPWPPDKAGGDEL